MNARSLLAAAALAAAGSAFAQSGPSGQESGPATAFTPSMSREQVQAELVQFRQDYPVSPWSFRYDPLVNFRSALSREQVRAGYLADREEVTARTSEDGGAALAAQLHRGSTVSPTLAAADAGTQLR